MHGEGKELQGASRILAAIAPYSPFLSLHVCMFVLCVQSCYVDPVMMMYRGNSKVDEIVQRIIAHEEPVELWPSVKKDLEKSQDHCEHFLWAVHAPSVCRTQCQSI